MWQEKIIDDELYYSKIRMYKNIFFYGAGSKGMQTFELLKKKGIKPVAFLDSNDNKWGKDLCGIPIESYQYAKEFEDRCILITTVYRTAISIKKCLIAQGETCPIIVCSNPFKSEVKTVTKKEVEACSNAGMSFELLSDEKSKNIYIDWINWKITGDNLPLAVWTEGDWLEFFSSSLVPFCDDYTFIDVGAYTGDTLMRFLSFVRGKYKKIIAFEPDSNNYACLKDFISNGRIPTDTIEINQVGLWSREDELTFFSASDGNAYESSNFYVDTNDIITISRKRENRSSNTTKMKVHRLDDCLNSIEGNVILKIDALSSEFEILCGSEKLIRERKPIIIMELGTRYSNMFDAIPFINSINSNYTFYLRQLSNFDTSRTILIAK